MLVGLFLIEFDCAGPAFDARALSVFVIKMSLNVVTEISASWCVRSRNELL